MLRYLTVNVIYSIALTLAVTVVVVTVATAQAAEAARVMLTIAGAVAR